MVEIQEIMSEFVTSVEKTNNTFEAANLMALKGISCLIVQENESVIGIITRRDILEKIVSQEKNPKDCLVEDIMSYPVHTVEPQMNPIFVAGIMDAKKIKQLPVVKDNKLLGIVTQTDIIKNINSIVGTDIKFS